MRLVRVGQVFVSVDDKMLSWSCGAVVDADGAPHAYAPVNSGLPALDWLGNAYDKDAKQWCGIICSDVAKQIPYVQGPNDPAPGFYVAGTALGDHKKADSDPTRYVNSEIVNYISIPPDLKVLGAHLGDLAVVTYRERVFGAIVADISPRKHMNGEMSIALAKNLGIPRSPKNGGCERGVTFEIILNSASTPAWPRPLDEIAAATTFGTNTSPPSSAA